MNKDVYHVILAKNENGIVTIILGQIKYLKSQKIYMITSGGTK